MLVIFTNLFHHDQTFLGPVHWAKRYGWFSTDWYPAVKGLNWNAIF